MMKNRFNFYLLCIENIKEFSLFSNQFDSVMMLKLFKTAFSFISLIEDEFYLLGIYLFVLDREKNERRRENNKNVPFHVND